MTNLMKISYCIKKCYRKTGSIYPNMCQNIPAVLQPRGSLAFVMSNVNSNPIINATAIGRMQFSLCVWERESSILSNTSSALESWHQSYSLRFPAIKPSDSKVTIIPWNEHTAILLLMFVNAFVYYDQENYSKVLLLRVSWFVKHKTEALITYSWFGLKKDILITVNWSILSPDYIASGLKRP